MKTILLTLMLSILMSSTAFGAEKKTVLKFFASWCGPCRSLSKVIATPEVQAELKNFNFLEVDTDKNQALAKKYRIDSLPTMVIATANRDEVDRKIGLMSKNELVEWLKRNK